MATDHAWSDIIVTTSQSLGGIHSRVDRFFVADGVALAVPPFTVGDPESGILEVWCREAIINGSISAVGAGHGGGGGGSGGAGGSKNGNSGSSPGIGRPDGLNGGSHGGWSNWACPQGGQPGGNGGGSNYGSGATNGLGAVTPGVAGGNGWYFMPVINVEPDPNNESVYLGGGGGGGAGGSGGSNDGGDDTHAGGAGGGGGAGKHGGGVVKIYAERIVVNGSIAVNGAVGTGDGLIGGAGTEDQDWGNPGGTGGHATSSGSSAGGAGGPAAHPGESNPGSPGAGGGGGAGGGVLLISCRGISTRRSRCSAFVGERIKIAGTVGALGSNGSQANGGAVKMLAGGKISYVGVSGATVVARSRPGVVVM